MALNSNALVTLEEVKQWLGNSTINDLVLEIYINGISDMILKMIGRNILATDYIENIQGTNTEYLLLKNYPVNSVRSVVIDGMMEMDSTDYEVDNNGIIFKGSGWWASGYSDLMSRRRTLTQRTIRVNYNAGYEEVPSDLKLLTLGIIKGQINFDTSGANGMKSYSISDVKITWADEVKFTESQMVIINNYKKVLI